MPENFENRQEEQNIDEVNKNLPRLEQEVEKNKEQEEKLSSIEESTQIAKNLLEQHEQELRDTFMPASLIKSDLLTEEDKKGISFGKSAIDYFFRKIGDEEMDKFVGHGISRGDCKENLAIFINVIQNNTLKGDYARIRNSGYHNARTQVDFFVISHIDKPLASIDKDGKQKRNEIGYIIDAGAYVVNARLYPIVNDLRAMFPDVNIIKANELPDFVKREAKG